MPIDLRFDLTDVALFADLYEFTVSAAFFEHKMNETAAFEVAMRRLPPNRGYMIAAGIERLIEALEEFHFDDQAVEHLDSLKLFKPEFLQFLAQLRFTGSVRALPEGAVFFAGEPILEICAPLIEGQLIETLALNQIGFATMVASKAARCFSAAGGRRLIDFGPRRAQGADAALIAARASYLAGFSGTASVAAGRRYGIPVYGTMSHSFVMAHERERQAFEDFTATFPRLNTLLVDTYDTPKGVRNAAEVGIKLKEAGVKLGGIRLDSGQVGDLAVRARRILDQAGLGDVPIFASGNLDEYRITELLGDRAPIDAFGVGTALAVSDDAPAGDFTYKLIEYQGQPRMKLSAEKISTPGRKQIFRARNATGACSADLVGLMDESTVTTTREFRAPPASVTAMLETQMESGRRKLPRPTLDESRAKTIAEIQQLDARLKALRKPSDYPVRTTAALNAMLIGEKLRAEQRQD
ncbi:MAG: nicotinate phosphoribosyltransferase [Candidatus Binataceae bacterium]